MAQDNNKEKKPKGRPAKKPEAKAAVEPNGRPSLPSGEPVSFVKESNFKEDLKLQVRLVQEGLYRLNESVREHSLNQINPDAPESLSPPGSTIHGNFLRSIALQVVGLKSVCQLAISLSFEPKVEITYDASGRIRSKKVTNTCGSMQAIAAWQNCLELEMQLADKLQSKVNSKMIIDVPEGGDRKLHAMHAMLRDYHDKVKIAEQEAVSVFDQFSPAD